jgi:hypothetical protein
MLHHVSAPLSFRRPDPVEVLLLVNQSKQFIIKASNSGRSAMCEALRRNGSNCGHPTSTAFCGAANINESPVQFAAKFELVIKLMTAKALGLPYPHRSRMAGRSAV